MNYWQRNTSKIRMSSCLSSGWPLQSSLGVVFPESTLPALAISSISGAWFSFSTCRAAWMVTITVGVGGSKGDPHLTEKGARAAASRSDKDRGRRRRLSAADTISLSSLHKQNKYKLFYTYAFRGRQRET